VYLRPDELSIAGVLNKVEAKYRDCLVLGSYPEWHNRSVSLLSFYLNLAEIAQIFFITVCVELGILICLYLVQFLINNITKRFLAFKLRFFIIL
jgi:hypothetical protein